MKPITMFVTSWCPYCNKALLLMDELKKENITFADIEVKVIDEELQPELAKKHDYYYVPTYYIDSTKLHEGAVTKDIISDIFSKAMEK